MFDTRHRFPFVAAALLFVGIAACSSASPRNQGTGGSGGEEETGGKTGSTGGKTGGTGGKAATGGSTGSTGGSTGSTGGSSGGDTGGSTGSTGGSTGSTGGSSGTGGSTGTGGSSGTGGMGGAVLACWADPKVVKICHQLENACENCGPKKAVACNNGANPKVCACFDLVNKAYAGMATDADCEKYFNENQCVVDNASTTGNTCGSLDCTNAACMGNKFGGKTCEEAKGWGDSSICNSFYAKCPCK